MNKKQLHEFMELTFDPGSIRAREIIDSMRLIDDDKITIEDYLRKCLKLIPETKAEQMFICFQVGSLQGEHLALKAYAKN